jgi:signal transduction histidine kinase
VLLWGLFTASAPTLPWFVPVCDAIAVVSMVVVGVLGSLDALLRGSRRSLPIVFIASATAVMWIGHFAIFPGDVPALSGQRFNQATSTLFLTINLATPLMLTFALVHRGGRLVRPRLGIAIAPAGGAALGLVIIAASVALGSVVHTISPAGEFFQADALVGVAGLIPAAFGLAAFFLGLHGDERIAGGVLAALTFSALNSIDLLYLHVRYSPPWYADHVLAMLPFAALVAGQLWLYATSVLAERRAATQLIAAAERRKTGLDVAASMARETDLMLVVDRLLSGVLAAVAADRVTMLRLTPEGFVVERSIDRDRLPANLGTVLPIDSVVTESGRTVVREAVESRRPVVLGAYWVEGLDALAGAGHAGIMRSVVMPLVRAGTVDGVLVAGRRDDRPFRAAEVERLEELGAIAALLIANARFLAEVESSSRAKSNFINLAAHELGTPIAVIRGYVEMLADETLGPIGLHQREPLHALRSTVQDLASRVEQLLVASRLEAGMSPPVLAAGVSDLTDVVRDAVDRAEDRARLIGADIAAEVPAEEIAVAGNGRDLGIILDNLLNNAMTYSHSPARIRVQVADGVAPEVRVADSGIGIPEHARDRIFDQFYRVDDEEFGYPAGTGLGLYISRRLAERSGAELFLDRSSPADGSVFTLRLKRSEA